MDHLKELTTNEDIFFGFMKEKYPIFFNSNIFLRDLQYGIRSYFEKKDIDIDYPLAERLAHSYAEHLENDNKFIKISGNAWKVNFLKTENVTEESEEKSK
ncbi:MAG: hypothetical protein K9J16_15410 [Melioribacteraceae bacterium]|nr:hypothetical protein [Melioribacteraceae bacterium]MCF8355937.1 hypothetical protein [Melioribacteraceae bacterium]MCF8395818.1 hypothetical protein [Melioribacteraceae bacterium]MCF8420810.1 hypothetical protein [Melioribacteraceae bacterium]